MDSILTIFEDRRGTQVMKNYEKLWARQKEHMNHKMLNSERQEIRES